MYFFIPKKMVNSAIVGILFVFGTVTEPIYSYNNCNLQRSMRILFVVGYFPKISETFIMNQITNLIDRGHEVFIYSFRKGDLSKVHADIYKYRLLQRTFYGRFPAKVPKFDIIYCQFGMHGARLLKLKKRYKFKSKLVTCFRGSDVSSYLKAHPRAYRELFCQGDLFLPVCKFFKKRLIKCKCKSERIVVHHSAIDCEKFSYKERKLQQGEKVHLMTAGRLIEKKGIKYVIRAVARLVKKNPNITYTIIGDGPLRKKLSALIEKLGLKNNVHLYGWATQDEVATLLDEAHIFVLSSVEGSDGNQEGIPNVLKEAMARGVPVISTFQAGIPELIEDGKSGFLVPPGNVSELTKKIRYLIEHPEIWIRMGQAGRKKVEQEFEIKKIIDTLERMFRSLLKKERKCLLKKERK